MKPNWDDLVARLSGEIQKDKEKLCQMATTPEKTVELRCRIAAFREVIEMPERDLKKARLLDGSALVEMEIVNGGY